MTEFWDKPAEKSGKVLAVFLEGLPLARTAWVQTHPQAHPQVQVLQRTLGYGLGGHRSAVAISRIFPTPPHSPGWVGGIR